MNKTQEIYEWWKHSMESGSVCCKTDSYYLNTYLLQYNEALRMYIREKIPEVK